MLKIDKKRSILYALIREIFSSDFSTQLALKWNIVAHYIHGLDRLSPYLEIDIVRHIGNEDIFLDYMKDIMSRHGELKATIKKENSYTFALTYGDKEDMIRIDFDKMIFQENQYEIINFLGIELLAQDSATIFTHQLLAITDILVINNRDLYDMCTYLNRDFALNALLIEEKTSKNPKEYLIYLREYLEKYGNPMRSPENVSSDFDTQEEILFSQKTLLEESLRLLKLYIPHLS